MILKAFLTALLLSMFTALQVSAELTGRVVDKTSGAPWSLSTWWPCRPIRHI